MAVTTTRMRIVNEVAERNRKEHEAYLEEKLVQARQVKRRGTGMGSFKGPKTGKTVRNFKESVRPIVRPVIGAKGFSELKIDKVVKDTRAVIAFDKRYKPYIFDLLEKHHGFKPSGEIGLDGNPVYKRGPLEMECVYHDVLSKLMLGAIDGFDMSQERVGKGAFRRYLKLVTACAVSDAISPDLVPVYKPDGTPEYTGEIVKDRAGKPKLDEKGDVIYKQRKEYRQSFEAKNIQNAIVQTGLGGTIGGRRINEWTTSDIVGLRVFFAMCAYLKLTHSKMKSNKDGWILKAMLDIFENGKDEGRVRDELLKSKVIKTVGTFYVAKTRFLNEWKAIQETFEKDVLKKVDLARNCQLWAIDKERPLRRGVYLWRPIVDRRKASDAARKLMEEIKALVGSPRVKRVNDNFARIMEALVNDADKRMADKKAKRFAHSEKELNAEAALKTSEE